MKKLMAIFMLFFSLCIQSLAQPASDSSRQGKMQKIKAIYVAYITDELSLTENEAQKFWPVCKSYEADLKNANQGDMDELVREEKKLNIRKQYQEKFIKVIGKERTNIFYRKDAEFKKRVADRIKDMRKQNRGQGGRKHQGREQKY